MPGGMSDVDAKALLSEASRSPLSDRYGCGVLDAVQNGVRTGNVVGVIQSDIASLEILPKMNTSTGEVRRRIVDMLRIALDLETDLHGPSHLSTSSGSFLEQLIGAYLQTVSAALKKGLPRRYIRHRGDLPVMRGSLVVARQFSTLTSRPGKLACQFSELSPDQPLNQVVAAALRVINKVSRLASNKRLSANLLTHYDAVTILSRPEILPLTDDDAIVLDRLNDHWHAALAFSQLILRNRSLTTTRGVSQGYSLLFVMHQLFENYLAKLFAQSLEPLGWGVTTQVGSKYCARSLSGFGDLVQSRPDLKLTAPCGRDIILDTKWKDPAGKGVSSSDVYQMMAYADLHDSDPVVLLYPSLPVVSPNHIMRVSDRYRLNTQCSADLLLVHVDISRSNSDLIQAIRDLAPRWLAQPTKDFFLP